MLLGGYRSGRGPSTTGTCGASHLTSREREVVQLLAEGKTTKEVAVRLGVSVNTAETHRSNIMRKLDLHSLSQLVLYAVRNDIIRIPTPCTTAAMPLVASGDLGRPSVI